MLHALASHSPSTLVELKSKETGQIHENHRAKVVLLHEPDMPIFMGALHPDGSLYENPVNLREAQAEHRHLVEVLEKNGIQTVRVRDILKMDTEENLRERLRLEKLAVKCLKYSLDSREGVDASMLSARDRYLLSDDYKEKILSEMSTDAIVDIILTNPTIYLRKADINTTLSSTSITFSPLSNLVFCRDQQITTQQGIIMGQLNSTTRFNEIAVTKFCIEKLGLKIAGEIPPPGKLEGGDFFPAGEHLCLIGTGLRTNMWAVQYCLDHNLFGSTRVAVVKDCFDWHQERMHLDTIFNIVNESTVVLLDTVMGEKSEIRRLVDLYERVDGAYKLVLHDMEFQRFLEDILKWHIIPMTQRDQANYGINFLNIGNGHLICPDMEAARKIAKDEHGTGKIEVINYSHVSHMYGSIHCSTQALFRELPVGESATTPHVLPTRPPVFPPFPTQHPQNTDTVLMVPPTGFFFNTQAALDNTFMNTPTISKHDIQRAAMIEYSKFIQMLTDQLGINVHLCMNDRQDAPDSVYPNNWFSTHPSKENSKNTLVLYPMKHESRRRERIPETIKRLREHYHHVIDLSSHESDDMSPSFLEGTGVLVIDRVNKVAYMCESPRADPKLANLWAKATGYELFNCGVAVDKTGDPVYHTNVVMGIGAKVAVVCLSSFVDKEARRKFEEKLGATHQIIDISFDQMHHFCGNVIELWSPKHQAPVMIMSDTAYGSFSKEQLHVLEKHGVHIGHSPIPTIEKYGGGGVRCCIAELF